jgi:hypothetical protein
MASPAIKWRYCLALLHARFTFAFAISILVDQSSLSGITQGDFLSKVEIYKLSTLVLAHGVLRKNLSDDLIEGSLLKQLISIL